MKAFNAIQIVLLLMASPTLLNLCWNAEFIGARALFWVGSLGAAALAIWSMVMVYDSMDD